MYFDGGMEEGQAEKKVEGELSQGRRSKGAKKRGKNRQHRRTWEGKRTFPGGEGESKGEEISRGGEKGIRRQAQKAFNLYKGSVLRAGNWGRGVQKSEGDSDPKNPGAKKRGGQRSFEASGTS